MPELQTFDPRSDEVLRFWFDETRPAQWWSKDPAFDRLIAARFDALHAQAACCELHPWRNTARGRLAEIIVLDQFSRNIHRDTPGAFASDALALALSQEAIAGGAEAELEPEHKCFLYMPYMHSESLVIHDIAVVLFGNNGLPDNFDFELKHRRIIERFGRYPHRNAILGRECTPEEVEFLKLPGSGF